MRRLNIFAATALLSRAEANLDYLGEAEAGLESFTENFAKESH